jgi:capsid protein
MISSLVDNTIAVFSPSWAAKRAIARKRLNQISRSYDAGKKTRTNADWKVFNQSADRTLLADADLIRARARDLVRNDAYARRAVAAIQDNVIGCGIVPRPNVGSDDQNKIIRESWQQWANSKRHCDHAKRLNFYQMQRLLIKEQIEAGEVLVHQVTNGLEGARKFPLIRS